MLLSLRVLLSKIFYHHRNIQIILLNCKLFITTKLVVQIFTTIFLNGSHKTLKNSFSLISLYTLKTKCLQVYLFLKEGK